MPGERVTVPALSRGRGRAERTYRLTVAAMVVAAVATLARAVRDDPAALPWVVGAVLLLGGIPLGIRLDTVWLDTARGLLCRRRAGVAYVEIPWADVEVLRFHDCSSGLVVLRVRGRHHRWATLLPVVACDRRGLRSQPVVVLWRLADEVRRWARPDQHSVADELDAQADHLQRTGRILDSPLLQGYCVRLPPG